ncbi:MAG: thiamine pyrophosphate-dependent dehydrogenase E1 component subunit alpha [Atopobiaceae bacterium]|jgi:pyruvate dehydrogenase E1 component alpha subunit|nr:thiamine pyrophosphate-dependent dehydrogenase E1 component subunit alpha [Atopobiaceae bacterium]MCI1389334.1 thiamine pyrophosphate-dependent dehydrogenase E1 component subunit alpha [Atopobiaceae bacterium]MCI1432397.1 thiamine pyrophosphate-dependent dehydrogenase E1 component subunit alpha [Atopobiaceae bacterium]MCI1470855.1 thiamine pyrophosphate-dependent dehydrogenase E1 component subunit alpha [Atopobiaceae bacterium]
MSGFPSNEKALGMYKKMYEIRSYEEKIYYLFLEGIMPGTIHQSHGQEACAVGMLYDLRKSDWMATTHRPAGHDLAKGVSLRSMMCEMFGKAEGCDGGVGGAMHTGDISVGAMVANAIVGADIPIAAGAALAFKMRGEDNVVVCFFGDGATNEGSYHETLNAAGLWKLPVVFVCENNLYSATTSIKLTCIQENVAADRASVYGIPSEVVDGNDVVAVNEAATRAIARARSGEGPTVLELKTYRHGGHSRNDACGYRPKEEEEEWFSRDPVKLFRARLIENGVATDEELEQIETSIDDLVEEEVEYAENAPFPPLDAAVKNVYWEGE